MNFVDWADQSLAEIISLSRNRSATGVDDRDIAKKLISVPINWSEYSTSKLRDSLFLVAEELNILGFTTGRDSDYAISLLPTQRGREFQQDPTSFWKNICEVFLDEHQQQLLKLANILSHNPMENYAEINWRNSASMLSNFYDNGDLLFALAKELAEIGFLQLRSGAFGVEFAFRSTYKGLVWETKRSLTLHTKFIDNLVNEWETTSVDFKRELYLDTKDQKAEFIKDVLGLVNTQASGARWLIIGFDDKTRLWHNPPDPKLTQNRIEQILADNTDPVVEVEYKVIDYREGLVGQLLIKRDPTKLPYKAAKSIKGEKKQVEQGTIFVRHGTQTEPPTEKELEAILAEGERARKLRDEKNVLEI